MDDGKLGRQVKTVYDDLKTIIDEFRLDVQ